MFCFLRIKIRFFGSISKTKIAQDEYAKKRQFYSFKGFDLTKIHLHFRWKAKAYIVNDGIWARLSNGYFMPYVRSLGTSRATHRARTCMSLPYFFCQEAGKVAKWTNPFLLTKLYVFIGRPRRRTRDLWIVIMKASIESCQKLFVISVAFLTLCGSKTFMLV